MIRYPQTKNALKKKYRCVGPYLKITEITGRFSHKFEQTLGLALNYLLMTKPGDARPPA